MRRQHWPAVATMKTNGIWSCRSWGSRPGCEVSLHSSASIPLALFNHIWCWDVDCKMPEWAKKIRHFALQMKPKSHRVNVVNSIHRCSTLWIGGYLENRSARRLRLLGHVTQLTPTVLAFFFFPSSSARIYLCEFEDIHVADKTQKHATAAVSSALVYTNYNRSAGARVQHVTWNIGPDI